jgi:hypothetical protein
MLEAVFGAVRFFKGNLRVDQSRTYLRRYKEEISGPYIKSRSHTGAPVSEPTPPVAMVEQAVSSFDVVCPFRPCCGGIQFVVWWWGRHSEARYVTDIRGVPLAGKKGPTRNCRRWYLNKSVRVAWNGLLGTGGKWVRQVAVHTICTPTKKASGDRPAKPLFYWSGREDLNLRPPEPHSGALPRLRHVPPRYPRNYHLSSRLSRCISHGLFGCIRDRDGPPQPSRRCERPWRSVDLLGRWGVYHR